MAKTQNTKNNRNKLSERQQNILDFIESYLEENGYPPTIREIGLAVDIPSTSVVNYNLNKLVREGFLARSQKVSRGLLLVKEDEPTNAKTNTKPARIRPLLDNIIQIPMAGQIVASRPVEFFDYHHDEDEIVDVPISLIGNNPPDQVFALNVSGNSMIDAMVQDGDTVILRRQQTADSGDMVAVWLRDSNESTLKFFYKEGTRIRLQPANPEMDAIYVDAKNVDVMGRVLAVMRKL